MLFISRVLQVEQVIASCWFEVDELVVKDVGRHGVTVFNVRTEVVVVLIDRLSQVLTNITCAKVGIFSLEFHYLVCNQLFLVRSQSYSFLAELSDESPIPCVLHTEHIAQIGINDINSFRKRSDSPEIVIVPSGFILLCHCLILQEDRVEPVGNRIVLVESIRDVFQLLLSVVSVKGTTRVYEVAEESHEFRTEVFSDVGKTKSLSVLRLNLEGEGADSQQKQCGCLQDHQIVRNKLQILIYLLPLINISYTFIFLHQNCIPQHHKIRKKNSLDPPIIEEPKGIRIITINKIIQTCRVITWSCSIHYQITVRRINLSKQNKKSGFSISPKRHQQKSAQRPDPWTYIPEDRNVKLRSPYATIGRQTRIQKQINSPSPADYLANYNIVFHSIRRPIFGTERRLTFRGKDGPGPANYEKTSDMSQTYRRFVKIGRDKRDQPNQSRKDLPAPNNYQQESDIDLGVRKKKGYSIGQRLRFKTETNLPKDYQKYNTDKVAIMRKMPAFTFQKSLRKQEEKESVGPGPAAYFPHQHQDEGPKIGKSIRRLHSVTSFPGPQSYVVPALHLSPSYSIPKNIFKNGVKDQTPAPNEYIPQLPQSKKYKSISIGVADRSNLAREDKIPGPGQYNITVRSTKGFSIGKQERINSGSVVSPGPAHYFVNPFTARSKSTRHL